MSFVSYWILKRIIIWFDMCIPLTIKHDVVVIKQEIYILEYNW